MRSESVRGYTVLNVELDGEVVQSVLGGDLICKYVIYLPDEIVKKYT